MILTTASIWLCDACGRHGNVSARLRLPPSWHLAVKFGRNDKCAHWKLKPGWPFNNAGCYNRKYCRDVSRFAPSQWETALLCNDVSHWLDASLDIAMYLIERRCQNIFYSQSLVYQYNSILQRTIYPIVLGYIYASWRQLTIHTKLTVKNSTGAKYAYIKISTLSVFGYEYSITSLQKISNVQHASSDMINQWDFFYIYFISFYLFSFYIKPG